MQMKHTLLSSVCGMALLICGATPLSAQTMLGLPDASSPMSAVPGASVLEGIPGIGGLFGGGDDAKESTQLAHMALHEAGNAARLAELVSHTESWIVQLMRMAGPVAGPTIAEYRWMLQELQRIRTGMAEIVADPSQHGTYEGYGEFVGMQHERSAGRIEDLGMGLDALNERATQISMRTAELMAQNEAAEGGIQVQQIGNEINGLNVDMLRQQNVLLQELIRSSNEQEARNLENQQLHAARWCALLPESPDCGGNGAFASGR